MRSRLRVAGALALAGLVASSAYALPWDIDMADSQAVKAYERRMSDLPDGVVSQPSTTAPRSFHANYVRGSAEGEALRQPLESSEATLVTGKQMYATYCAPCHGVDGINLGPVAQPGRLPGVVPLAGGAGVAKSRSDAWIYLTIRNGGAVMPSYGHAMADEEIWATVAFVRTLESSKYVPPAPEVP
jgi:mono/diheme cytochrome c family protein